MSVGRFQCGIAAILYHPQTKTYLLLKRSAQHEVGRGDWECVTGRVDQGESFETALRREVREELGVEIHIEFIVGTSHFYRGEVKPEHELLGLKYACAIEDRDAIRMSSEHSEYGWFTAEEVDAFLPSGHWLRESIRRAERTRELLPPELLQLHRTEGFEGQ